MTAPKVVKRSQIPSNVPWVGTAVAYLMLDRFNAAGWVWGVVGTLYAVVWMLVLVVVWNEKQIDVIRDAR